MDVKSNVERDKTSSIDLLFGTDRLRYCHAYREKNRGYHHYQRLHNVKVVHMDIMPQHIVIRGDISRLITPCQLRSDNQENTPSTQDSENCTACELIIADSRYFGRDISSFCLDQKAVIFVISCCYSPL